MEIAVAGTVFVIAFSLQVLAWAREDSVGRAFWLVAIVALIFSPMLILAKYGFTAAQPENLILISIAGSLAISTELTFLVLWSDIRERRGKFKKTFDMDPPKEKLGGVSDPTISSVLNRLAFECRVAEQNVYRWDSGWEGLPDFKDRLQKRIDAREELEQAIELANKFGFDVNEPNLAKESIPHPDIGSF